MAEPSSPASPSRSPSTLASTAAKPIPTPFTSSKAEATTSSTPPEPAHRRQLGFQIALGIATSEAILRAAGARNFLIPNIFNLALAPEGHANAAFNTAAVLATNKDLNGFLQFEQLLPGVRINRLDSFDLFQAIADDATHFGFTDIVDPCLSATFTVCADPAHTLFWDGIHPTVFGHSFLAVTIEAIYAH